MLDIEEKVTTSNGQVIDFPWEELCSMKTI